MANYLWYFLYFRSMEIVVSGVRPTGNLHLGNYFGAIRNFVKMQEEYQCYFFIADYHSLTTHPNPADLHANVKQVLVEFIASGIDPDKATIYVQSDIPEIPELYLLFNMIAHKGELERSTTYKEKVSKQKNNINAGLLTYPVLMAADVIIHRATKVPVGKDQAQHLEMTRTFVNRFNHLYETDYFPEPHAFNYSKNLIKVPGLDGAGKMGKSEGEGNAIYLNDEEESIRNKVKRGVTDGGPTEDNQEKPEIIQNLFDLMAAVSTPETVEGFEKQYNDCSIRYSELKGQLAEDIINFTKPIKARIDALSSDETMLKNIANKGKEKARESACQTLKDVREIIGMKSF